MVVSNGDDFLFVFGCFAGTNILGTPHELGLKIFFCLKLGYALGLRQLQGWYM